MEVDNETDKNIRIEIIQGWLDWLEQGGTINKTELLKTLKEVKNRQINNELPNDHA
jgi:hypothetical protein